MNNNPAKKHPPTFPALFVATSASFFSFFFKMNKEVSPSVFPRFLLEPPPFCFYSLTWVIILKRGTPPIVFPRFLSEIPPTLFIYSFLFNLSNNNQKKKRKKEKTFPLLFPRFLSGPPPSSFFSNLINNPPKKSLPRPPHTPSASTFSGILREFILNPSGTLAKWPRDLEY